MARADSRQHFHRRASAPPHAQTDVLQEDLLRKEGGRRPHDDTRFFGKGREDVERLARSDAEPPPLSDRVAERSLVRAEDLSTFIGDRPWARTRERSATRSDSGGGSASLRASRSVSSRPFPRNRVSSWGLRPASFPRKSSWKTSV